jgi:acetyl/propionyl-CoA carboxylase alpha subunit
VEYKLKVKEETIPVTIEQDKDIISVSIDDNTSQVSYSVISENQIHLVVDGKSINAYVTGNTAIKSIAINGSTFIVEDADAVSTGPKKSGKGELPDKVTPLMPSVVVAVKVSEGGEVEKGQGVVVLSAMKMETTLFAPYSGKVSKINTAEGKKVMPGDILVEIEKNEEDTDE